MGTRLRLYVGEIWTGRDAGGFFCEPVLAQNAVAEALCSSMPFCAGTRESLQSLSSSGGGELRRQEDGKNKHQPTTEADG